MKARAWQVLTATRRPLKTLAYLVEAAVLNRWARSRRITHVHVHFANPAATVAMIGAAAGVFSYSMSVHGPDVFYDVPGGLLPQKLSHALFVRCISHFCRSQCARCLPFDCWSRLEVVRCGVDPGAFSPAATAASGESAGVPEILCVGRLVPAKGQHVLLQACSELQSRGVAFHLSFVGDGPDRGSLEHLAAELGLASAVTFAGVVGQGEIQAYYDRATVFCLPSFAEGVPVVLMEAMAKEIPVVSTRITGIPELVDDGVHGALITPSDSNGLADALARILSLAPGVRREMGRAGRRRVCETYDLAANCRVLAGVFDRRLARRRPAGVPTA
jgi:glycosyltransferase involved in cell wall biosynthesis